MSQIIVDEQLHVQRVLLPLQRWTTARRITSLRLGTVIKDDVIPSLLAQEKQPTFVTMNIKDFWKPALRDKRYCMYGCARRASKRNTMVASPVVPSASVQNQSKPNGQSSQSEQHWRPILPIG